MKKIQLLSGNEACVEGALAAGVRFFAGYPITPSSEIAELMAKRLPEVDGKFIQMEDEIASLAAVIGASLAGLKAMDATSGPGFSLKAENLGLAIMMEVPCVIVNVQRVGPSTGMATSPAQGDVMMSRWGTHGDHPIIVLSPWSVRETFDLTVRAVNLSERFRTPVILLSDAIIARMREDIELPGEVEIVDRPRPTVLPAAYRPYAAIPSDVPPMADFGSGYHWYANSSMHDENGFEATGDPQAARALISRLHAKIERHREEIVHTVEEMMDDAEIALFAYGCVARSARAAMRIARTMGLQVGLIRGVTLWPFPEEEVRAAAERVRAIVVPEMNAGQLVEKVREAAGGRTKVISLPRYDGVLITPEQILEVLKRVLTDDPPLNWRGG
ncbi:MAG: 2-oxoacid:acceptor oxidoreductase subunit alpha [Chloroflexi bacterium]|nr:2-oxoacid:acceptor oxidoreductase subunit alpha [Chloroflexota bacterium]MCL5074291.1 2-oxoacid:acceptor oxidoreductase subunit alpha [Chloroflexota bacterium]